MGAGWLDPLQSLPGHRSKARASRDFPLDLPPPLHPSLPCHQGDPSMVALGEGGQDMPTLALSSYTAAAHSELQEWRGAGGSGLG